MIPTLERGGVRTSFSLGEAVPTGVAADLNPFFSLTIAGWSMAPTLMKGDVIHLEPAGSIEPGDLVVYRHLSSLICHRVTRIWPDGSLSTRGDRAAREDSAVHRTDVLGKVTTVTRGGRTVTAEQPVWMSAVRRMRRHVGLLLAAIEDRLRTMAVRIIERLKRNPSIRRAASAALRRRVRFYAGYRVPLQMIEAYRFVVVGTTASADATAREGGNATGRPVILARCGRVALASFDPDSGRIDVRRWVTGLGLEEALRACGERLGSSRTVETRRELR